MKIITNHHPRLLLYWEQLTPKEQKEFTFDHKEEANYFRYRNWVYTISDFMRCSGPLATLGYDGYTSGSFFSGILIKYVEINQGQAVICATFLS